MERQFAALVFVKRGVENNADRTGIRCAVGQAAAPAIDRARIHASAAADAFQRMPKVRHAEPSASTFIDEDDVKFAAFPRPGEM